jgi:hypothetical protein
MKFNWRKSYEPFRGNVYEFGNYLITEIAVGGGNTMFEASHSGQKLGSFLNWTDAAQACEENAR